MIDQEGETGVKITTFNPMIVTPQADEVVKLFEALGFERRHHKISEVLEGTSDYRMKDPNGFHVDVAQSTVPRDMSMIRMNVDNFEEACTLLEARGLKPYSGNMYDGKTSKDMLFVAPSGLLICLCQHKRGHD